MAGLTAASAEHGRDVEAVDRGVRGRARRPPPRPAGPARSAACRGRRGTSRSRSGAASGCRTPPGRRRPPPQPGRGGVGGGWDPQVTHAGSVERGHRDRTAPARPRTAPPASPAAAPTRRPSRRLSQVSGLADLARWSKLPWAPMSSLHRLVEVVAVDGQLLVGLLAVDARPRDEPVEQPRGDRVADGDCAVRQVTTVRRRGCSTTYATARAPTSGWKIGGTGCGCFGSLERTQPNWGVFSAGMWTIETDPGPSWSSSACTRLGEAHHGVLRAAVRRSAAGCPGTPATNRPARRAPRSRGTIRRSAARVPLTKPRYVTWVARSNSSGSTSRKRREDAGHRVVDPDVDRAQLALHPLGGRARPRRRRRRRTARARPRWPARSTSRARGVQPVALPGQDRDVVPEPGELADDGAARGRRTRR